jgi:hypothetical protein
VDGVGGGDSFGGVFLSSVSIVPREGLSFVFCFRGGFFRFTVDGWVDGWTRNCFSPDMPLGPPFISRLLIGLDFVVGVYSTSPRDRNRVNRNHLEICLTEVAHGLFGL